MGLLTIAVAFTAVAKKNDDLLKVLSEEMMDHEINTPLRSSHFLAQMSHESAGFTRFVENLNYSSEGLLKIFGKYFKNGLEEQYARQPQKIANRVYASRMGNGDEASGDGWRFRGRGIIQITGRNNYKLYSQLIFKDDRLLQNPDLAADLSVACKIACVYWSVNKLNELADRDDLIGITRRINGATIGIAHRRDLLNKAKKAIGI